MNEEAILELIKSKVTIHIEPHWGQYHKSLKVELRLDNVPFTSDEVAMSEIREDF